MSGAVAACESTIASIRPDEGAEIRQKAISDPEWERICAAVMEESRFLPLQADLDPPYDMTLGVAEGRLILTISAGDRILPPYEMSLRPYKRLIQDYFTMIRSYEAARSEGCRHKLESIDMGRRGLHNEAAELLQNRLQNKIEMDFATARNLFSLLCCLCKNDRDFVN